jgi:L-malate glycosyltransferase
VTAVHQILVGAAPGDAITLMAQDIRKALEPVARSEIFARFPEQSMRSSIGDLGHLPPGLPSDVIVYHSSYGDPTVTKTLLSRPERLVIAYHNITPSQFFADHDPRFAFGLEWGRCELQLLRDRTALAVADSHYNAAELSALGYGDVTVIPAGVRPRRLTGLVPDGDTLDELRRHVSGRFVLGVSQLLPHKRPEVLIQALHVLQWIHGVDVGLVLVGHPRMAAYHRALHELVRRLKVRDVWIAGSLSNDALAGLYRSAQVFAAASRHEGLGIPPLEAMAFGLPTVVRDAGATAETVGDGALVLPADAGPLLYAEALATVLDDAVVRARMISAGNRRIAELDATDSSRSFVDTLRTAGLLA